MAVSRRDERTWRNSTVACETWPPAYPVKIVYPQWCCGPMSPGRNRLMRRGFRPWRHLIRMDCYTLVASSGRMLIPPQVEHT